MKKLLTCYFLLLGTIALSGQTLLEGKITDGETGEEMIGANILILQNNVFKAGISTDFDGNYLIELEPGTYDVAIKYIGYGTQRIEGVIIEADKRNKLDVAMAEPVELICYYPIISYHPPLFDMDNPVSGKEILNNHIEKLPTKNIREISALAPGVSIRLVTRVLLWRNAAKFYIERGEIFRNNRSYC